MAVGRGLYTARATFPSHFTFQARDAYSNDLEASTGGETAVPWNLTGYISAPAPSSQPGYIGSRLPKHGAGDVYAKGGGRDLLTVLLDGEHISEAPSVSLSPTVLDAATSMATGDGLWGSVAGEMLSSRQARDHGPTFAPMTATTARHMRRAT